MHRVEKAIEVGVPVNVAYRQWTQFEELPRFMQGILEVEQLDERQMRWVAEVGGEEKTWSAEISEQVPDRRVAWQSIDGMRNAGAVQFQPVSPNATQVHLTIEYDGDGVHASDFFAAGHRVEEGLARFKTFVEACEQDPDRFLWPDLLLPQCA